MPLNQNFTSPLIYLHAYTLSSRHTGQQLACDWNKYKTIAIDLFCTFSSSRQRNHKPSWRPNSHDFPLVKLFNPYTLLLEQTKGKLIQCFDGLYSRNPQETCIFDLFRWSYRQLSFLSNSFRETSKSNQRIDHGDLQKFWLELQIRLEPFLLQILSELYL